MMDALTETSGPSWVRLGLVSFLAALLLIGGGVVMLLFNLGPTHGSELATSIVLMQSGGIVLVVSVFLMLGTTFLRH